MSPSVRVRIEAGALHLHGLGPRAMTELLLELAPADRVLDRLERYRRISPALLRMVGGDRFARRLSPLLADRQRS